MATNREKILERRKKLEEQRFKEEEKLKRLKEQLKKTETRILESEKQEERERQFIIGRIFSERMKDDETLKTWFEKTITSHLTHSREKLLFGLPGDKV